MNSSRIASPIPFVPSTDSCPLWCSKGHADETRNHLLNFSRRVHRIVPSTISLFSLELDLGPDSFVHIINANLGEKLKKSNLKGQRGLPGDDLGNDNRRSARNKPPGKALGQTSQVRVLGAICGHDPVRFHGRVGRRLEVGFRSLMSLPRHSSFSGFHEIVGVNG